MDDQGESAILFFRKFLSLANGRDFDFVELPTVTQPVVGNSDNRYNGYSDSDSNSKSDSDSDSASNIDSNSDRESSANEPFAIKVSNNEVKTDTNLNNSKCDFCDSMILTRIVKTRREKSIKLKKEL